MFSIRPMLALAIGASTLFSGCIVYEQPVVVRHEPVIVAQAPAPVVVAPGAAAWQRMTYRYYPDQQIYYNVDLGRWYWIDEGRWADAPRLPDPIRLGLTTSVVIKLDGNRPRAFHDRVYAMYPPRRGPDYYPPNRPPYSSR